MGYQAAQKQFTIWRLTYHSAPVIASVNIHLFEPIQHVMVPKVEIISTSHK
jgi:hypothetical protein